MAAALVLSLLAAQTPQAVTPDTKDPVVRQTGGVSYDAAFFASFAPRTAFDMISRLPGFSLQEGNFVRGLSGGGGNVFVNGARPVTKDVSLEDYLRRLPAASVARIEIVDGSAMGLDAAGFRLVANVVLRTDSQTSGVATLRALGTTAGSAGVSGQVSWQGTIAGFALNLGGEYGITNLNRISGIQTVRNTGGIGDADGSIDESRANRLTASNVSIARTLGRLKTTATWSRRENPFRRDAVFSARPVDAAAPAYADIEQYRYRDRSNEGSLTNEATFGKHKLKLVLLGSQTRTFDDSFATVAPIGQPSSGSAFRQDQTQTEFIVRGAWNASFGTLETSLALENAYNTLRARTLFESVPPRVSPDRDFARVSELRRTIELGAVWPFAKHWTLNGVVARETSRVAVFAPSQARNTYSFVRGRLVANWQAAKILTVSGQFERTVGQLEFSDFVGAQQLFDGSSTVTNTQLRPSQTDTTSLTFDLRPKIGGGLNLKLARSKLRDVVDTIPTGNGQQGVGNIASATELSLEVSATVPLKAIWRGAELAFSGRWRDTRVTDPFNAQARPLQGELGDPLRIELRRAVNPHLNYGIVFNGPYRDFIFRRELMSEFRETSSFGLYIEQTIDSRLKARFAVDRLGGRQFNRVLTIYDGLRGASPIAQVERRRRDDAPLLQLRLERSF